MPNPRYLFISLGLHLAVIIVLVVGVLSPMHKKTIMPELIPVEIIEQVSDKTTTKESGHRPVIREEKKADQKKEVKKEVEKPPEAKPLEDKALEDKANVETPQVAKPEEKPIPKPEVIPERIPDGTQKEKQQPKSPEKKEVPPPEPEKTYVKPAPKKKPVVKPKQKDAPQKRDFMSVLKDLDSSKDLKQNDKNSNKKGGGGEKSDTLSISELDRVRRQIEQEWVFPRNTKEVGSYVVEIEINMNPDGTVQSARISDMGLMREDSYRILAESALRAVLVFKHKPLLLPRDKYQSWRQIKMGFNPEHML